MKSLKDLNYTISESNESGYDSNNITPMSDFSTNSKQQKMIKQLDISKFSVVKPNTKNELIEIESDDDEDNKKIEIKIKSQKNNKKSSNSSKKENIVNIDDDDQSTEQEDNDEKEKENKNVANVQKEDEIKIKRKNSPTSDDTFVVTKLLRTTPSFVPDSSPIKTILKETNKHLSNSYKICPECSNSNRTVARFCDNCGYKF